MMDDTLYFDEAPKFQQVVDAMREDNEANKNNQARMLEYIESKLSKAWNTPGGKIAIDELKKFTTENFQEYINYLDSKIDNFQDVVIPALIEIENA